MYASYVGLSFNGYMAIDVSDKIIHNDYEFTEITDFSAKMSDGVKSYIPFEVNILDSNVIIPACYTYKLNYQVLPAYAADKSVIFNSDNNSAATVSEDGTISGVSIGTATITVTTISGGISNTITVQIVQSVTGVTLNKDLNGK